MSRLNDIELLSRNNKNKILLDDIASVISNRTGVLYMKLFLIVVILMI